LPIVPAEAYLDRFWAPDRLNRLISEASKSAIELILRVEKKRDPNVGRLTETELLDWVSERGTDAIVNSFPFKGHKKDHIAAALTIIRVATAQNNDKHPGIHRLRHCFELKNVTPDQQLAEAKKGLSDITKALSFFIVPELPDSPPYGHVITLRDVRAIKA